MNAANFQTPRYDFSSIFHFSTLPSCKSSCVKIELKREEEGGDNPFAFSFFVESTGEEEEGANRGEIRCYVGRPADGGMIGVSREGDERLRERQWDEGEITGVGSRVRRSE